MVVEILFDAVNQSQLIVRVKLNLHEKIIFPPLSFHAHYLHHEILKNRGFFIVF